MPFSIYRLFSFSFLGGPSAEEMAAKKAVAQKGKLFDAPEGLKVPADIETVCEMWRDLPLLKSPHSTDPIRLFSNSANFHK